MSSTEDIDALIEMMAKLPGLGPRSARRAVLHLIRKRALLLTPLADVMQTVAATARECLNCGNVGTTDVCDICTSNKRQNGELCVVEDLADLATDEVRGGYEQRGAERVKVPGVLESFDLSQEDAEMLILQARVAAGWIDASELPQPEPEYEDEDGYDPEDPEAVFGGPQDDGSPAEPEALEGADLDPGETEVFAEDLEKSRDA